MKNKPKKEANVIRQDLNYGPTKGRERKPENRIMLTVVIIDAAAVITEAR